MSAVNPGFVAVQDLDSATAGAIVWWRLSGTMDRERLAIAFAGEKLSEKLLPELPSDGRALARAMRAHASNRILARPLANTKGWALVQENASADDVTHATMVTAKIDKEHGLRLSGAPAGAEGLTEMVKARFEVARQVLTLRDASAWLSHLIRTTQAVPLRDTGGVYFVPKTHVELYRSYARAIKAATAHTLFEVPALRSEEVVEAILEAVQTEVQNALEVMETELDTADLGNRALSTRQGRCEKLREKVKLYEGLLGRSMAVLTDGLQGLEANIVSAILAASADEE